MTSVANSTAAMMIALAASGTVQAQIHVDAARIGCLDLVENKGNLTGVVGAACNGRDYCPYQALTGDQYKAMGVQIHGRTFCTQGMEVVFHCGNNAVTTIRVPGDAWTNPPAYLYCPGNVPSPIGAQPSPTGLRGFVDLHTHPLSNLGFAGKLIYGGVDAIPAPGLDGNPSGLDGNPAGGSLLPADPNCNRNVTARSVDEALGHDKSVHGGWNAHDNGCGDDFRVNLILFLQSALGAHDTQEDATGYPDFSGWPTWDDVTHQKMWVDWIKRAKDGGLRVLVALAVNNKTLADVVAGKSPITPGDGPDDDRASADLQIDQTKQFVARHNDFMEIAYSADDLRRIVLSNRLAVVLGVEIDDIGNMDKYPRQDGGPVPGPVPIPKTIGSFPLRSVAPTPEGAAAEIDRLYAEGVRYIFPIHLLDNKFGGTAAYGNGVFDLSTYRETGRFWNLQCVPSTDVDWKPSNDFPPKDPIVSTLFGILEDVKLGGKIPAPPTPSNCTSDSQGVRNAQPLTALGEAAIQHMMLKGMLIDIDHMSELSANRALQLAEAVKGGYPMNSGHNGVRGHSNKGDNSERSFTQQQYRRIFLLHGMAGVGSAKSDAYQWALMYNRVLTAMETPQLGERPVTVSWRATGMFGTDFNGMEFGMPQPRGGTISVPDPRRATCMANVDIPDCTELKAAALTACQAKMTKSKQVMAACTKEYPNIIQKLDCHGDCGRPPVQYTSAFQPSRLGAKVWNYNADGVPHYGMLPDFLMDVRSISKTPQEPDMRIGGADLVDNNLLNGAEYFYQTWKLAEQRSAELIPSGVPVVKPPALNVSIRQKGKNADGSEWIVIDAINSQTGKAVSASVQIMHPHPGKPATQIAAGVSGQRISYDCEKIDVAVLPGMKPPVQQCNAVVRAAGFPEVTLVVP